MKNIELPTLITGLSALLWLASLALMIFSNIVRNKKKAIIVPFVTLIFSILAYHVFPSFILAALAVIAATLAVIFIEKEYYNRGPYVTCVTVYYLFMIASLALILYNSTRGL